MISDRVVNVAGGRTWVTGFLTAEKRPLGGSVGKSRCGRRPAAELAMWREGRLDLQAVLDGDAVGEKAEAQKELARVCLRGWGLVAFQTASSQTHSSSEPRPTRVAHKGRNFSSAFFCYTLPEGLRAGPGLERVKISIFVNFFDPKWPRTAK